MFVQNIMLCPNDSSLSQWKLLSLPLEWFDFKNSVESVAKILLKRTGSFKILAYQVLQNFVLICESSMYYKPNIITSDTCMFHCTVLSNEKKLIWIVFVVLGAIRDFLKTNYTENYKGLFLP